MEDEKIVELYLQRDETAISETAKKYGVRLQALAHRIVSDAQAAEECENETYLEAWNRIPPKEPRTYLFAFLGRIARHIAIDECRRSTSKKRSALLVELSAEMEECLAGEGSVEEVIEEQELSRAIMDFLSDCSLQQRRVFLRRYWFFDTIPEICQRYGYSESRVKTMLFRMRKNLKEHLEREGYAV